MDALSSEQLVAAGITDAAGLSAYLPSFDQQQNAGITTTSLRVRRIGSVGNIPTFEPAVGTFVDGAFRSRSFLGTSPLLAVDHVELLRGPQTALYGKNVSAGLLAVYTRKPSESFRADADVTWGLIDSPRSANDVGQGLDVSGPISSQLSAGLAVRARSHNDLFKNVLPGPDGEELKQWAARGQLLWHPDESLELRLLSSFLRQRDDEGEADVYLAPGAASTQVSTILQQLGLTPDCPDNVPRNWTGCSVDTNKLHLKAADLTLLGEYRLFDGLLVKSMTSWDRYDILRVENDAIQLFAPIFFYNDPERSRAFQQDVNLISTDESDFRWLAGSFFYRNDYERGDRGHTPMFGPNGPLAYNPIWPVLLGGLPLATPGQRGLHDSNLRTRYFSVYGQATWQLTPKFSLTSAVRWQEEEKRASIVNSVTTPGLSLISAILTPASTLDGRPVNGTLSRRTSNVPWSFTPKYRFDDRVLTYLTLARGSKSGGFNTGFGDAPLDAREYSDEDVRHLEIGVKANFSEHLTALNMAAFRTEYRNFQDAAFISAQFSVGNAERAEVHGAELDGSLALGKRFALEFSASFADLRYEKYTRALCYPGRAPDGSAPNTCSLSGRHPIQAPEWETQLALSYEKPLGAANLAMRLGWAWTDKVNTSFSADPRLTQDAWSDISLRAALRLGDRYELDIWGENLLNKTVSQFDLLLNLFNDTSYQSYLATPRRFGTTFRMRF